MWNAPEWGWLCAGCLEEWELIDEERDEKQQRKG